jgi:hypothetical protein
MAIMRASAGGASWLGNQKAGIKDVRDDSSKFEWSDVYLIFEMDTENSDYERMMKITGGFDWNPDGTVQATGLVRKINNMCDALGWGGGVNQHGKWVDENEELITDISTYLRGKFAQPNGDVDRKYLVYVFKEDAKDGKTYTRVHHRFFANIAGAEGKLTEHVDYMKKNGWIKESTGISGGAMQAVVVDDAVATELNSFDV